MKSEIAPLVSNLWHFPTVQVRKDPAGELANHLTEFFPKTSKRSLTLEPLSQAKHAVTYRNIALLPFRIRVARLPDFPEAKIVSLADVSSFNSLAVSNLTRKLAVAALAPERALAAAH